MTTLRIITSLVTLLEVKIEMAPSSQIPKLSSLARLRVMNVVDDKEKGMEIL
jgi:hypothetical protein